MGTVIERAKKRLDDEARCERTMIQRGKDYKSNELLYWSAFLDGAKEQRGEDIENALLNHKIKMPKCSECAHYLPPSGQKKIRKCYRPFRGGHGGGNMNPDDYCSYWTRRGIL